jgi:stage II sporulation protein AA (anti-sigma F factor antagonist)
MPATVPQPLLKLETVGDVLLVQFATHDVLDVHTIGLIGRQIAGLVEEGARKLLLNFRGVRRLSSLLAGKLVGLHRKMVAAGGELALCDIDPDVYEVFEILRLPRLLKIYATETEALARMQ